MRHGAGEPPGTEEPTILPVYEADEDARVQDDRCCPGRKCTTHSGSGNTSRSMMHTLLVGFSPRVQTRIKQTLLLGFPDNTKVAHDHTHLLGFDVSIT